MEESLESNSYADLYPHNKTISLILSISFILLYLYFYKNPNLQIEIDNEILYDLHENEINFCNYSSNLKPIAIYFPENKNEYINEHNITSKLRNEIILAKRHGIYGFAIFYLFNLNNTNSLNAEINILYNNNDFNFPFLLILKNFFDNISLNKDENYYNTMRNKIAELVNQIKKYLICEKYIRIHDKPSLLIENTLKLNYTYNLISFLRKKAKILGIGKIFIIYIYSGDEDFKRLSDFKYKGSFNAILDVSKYDVFNKSYNFYYSGIIYKNLALNENNISKIIFRNSLIEISKDFTDNKLKYFTPEKYYILNDIIKNWTKINYNKTNGFFFISSWNDYRNGNYLKPDEKYGFSLLNTFSKSLFNLPFNHRFFDFAYLKGKCIVAIQIHVYYEELFLEILNKINNIPIKFDLYVSTISSIKRDNIEESIKNYSKANKYEIKILENKGRDILPFITQMKSKYRKYKYICHLHTKKTIFSQHLGKYWREYIFENIIGNKEIISEIINNFEENEILGFIFPDTYYYLINYKKYYESIQYTSHKPNKKWMNLILNILFKRFSIGEYLLFPSGNMFWARLKAIYQVFKLFKYSQQFPKESYQNNTTIMHGIERIWLYLVKINGYKYQTIFKHY